MKYQIGQMGISEGIALAFIITFPPVFLTTPSMSIEIAGNLGWASPFMGFVLILISIYLLATVFKKYPGDLMAMAEYFLGKLPAKIIGLYYIVMFWLLSIFWIREFAENTLLTALPSINFHLAVIWYGLGAAVIVYAGLEAMCRATYLLLPFIAAGLVTGLILLYPFYEFNYLFPWQGYGLDRLAAASVGLTGAQAGAIILVILIPSFQNATMVKTAAVFGLGSSLFLRTLAIMAFVMIFGAKVGMEKTLPFYEMSRLVYLSRYIQRIESLFIILWVIVGILAIALSLFAGLYLLARMADLPTIRPLIPAVTFVTMQLATLPPDIITLTNMEMKVFTYYNGIGAVLIPLLLFVASLIKGRRKIPCAHEQ